MKALETAASASGGLTFTGICSWSLCLWGGMELEGSRREAAVEDATPDAADAAWEEMLGNQCLSMASTWSSVFRYFSLQTGESRSQEELVGIHAAP